MDRTRLRALLAARYAWLIVCAGRSAVVLAVGAQLMAPGPRPAMAQEVNGIYGVGFASYFWRRPAGSFLVRRLRLVECRYSLLWLTRTDVEEVGHDLSVLHVGAGADSFVTRSRLFNALQLKPGFDQ
jgi:hypothetical protein